jgi:hypothetical protein
MPFHATALRVFIASPSDMPEERDIAASVITEWNDLNASTDGVVLLPVRWETHSMPEAGIGPQNAINRQLVDSCDILIGMFWTKLGTSTGAAESGTVEEIDRFVETDRPAMLYFSRRPIDPAKIDQAQHARLHEFQAATYQKALAGTFNSLENLKHVLTRDLTRRIRSYFAGSPAAINTNRNSIVVDIFHPKDGQHLKTYEAAGNYTFRCRTNKIPGNDVRVVVARGGQWWPQAGRLSRLGGGNEYEFSANFGDYGPRDVHVVKVNDLGASLFDYYLRVGTSNQDRRKRIMSKHPEVDGRLFWGNYTPIPVDRHFDGLEIQGSVTVIIERPPN